MVGGKAAAKVEGKVAAGVFKKVLGFLRTSAKSAAKKAGQSAKKAANKAIDAAKRKAQSLRDGLKNLGAKGKGKELGSRCTGGDPIDVASGEVVLRQVDVELAGVLPLVLERAHVSSYREGRLFGTSWASTLDQRLEVDGSGVCFAASDGMVLSYPMPMLGMPMLPAEGPRWPLEAVPGGRYTISSPQSGQILHFASPGNSFQSVVPLVAITDRNGNRIDFHHEDGVLTEVRHSGGYRVGVESADGQVIALRLLTDNPNGQDGQISGDGQAGGPVLVRFGYDEAGDLAEVFNSSGKPTRFSYDVEGRLTGWTDRNGNWYHYAYDEQGRGVHGRGSDGFLDATLSYQEHGTVVTNSLGHATTYHLNELGQIVREVDPLGQATISEWDRYDRLVSRTDPLGRTTHYDYDEDGNLRTVTRPDGTQSAVAYNGLNLPIEVIDPDGAVWRQAYDERGNLIAVTDPMDATTRYVYNERGYLTAVTDPLGNTMRVQTDAAGLPTAVTDPLGNTTRYTRDPFGRVTAIQDPVGGVTRLSWTVEGKLASRVLPDGATERWSYDGEGNPVEYVDAVGHGTRTEYTHFDLPAEEMGPDGARLEFSYDTELRPTAVTNAQGLVWRYDYDPAGNLVRETDFDGRVLTYTHDAAGQLVERTNGAGQTVRYTRDPLGNVVEQRSGDAVTSFSYDPLGRMIRATNVDADVLFQRDRLGRVSAESSNGRVLALAYDAAGNRVRRRTPSGVESVWEYDPAGQPSALHTAGQTVQFGYDPAGREVERRIGPQVALTQTWDPNHRLAAQGLWAAPPQSAQQVGESQPAGQARLLQHRAYNYRADGHVDGVNEQSSGIRRLDLDPAGRVTAVRGSGWDERYAYDLAGNLTHADWPVAQQLVTADADAVGEREYAGTLIRRAGKVRYEHDAQGRVTLRQHRRLTAKPLTWRYTWDADDRMTGVVTPDGQQWHYRYDSLGRRIAKQRLAPDGVTVVEQTDFTWEGVVLAEQVHTTYVGSGPTGSRQAVRVTAWDWEPGGFRPVSQTQRASPRDAPQQWIDEQFSAIVTDLVGTPTEIVDPRGNIGWSSRATLWGSELSEPRNDAYCPLRFPGQYFDPETGLSYNYHRYYESATSRYYTADPLGLAPAPNPCAYVPNPARWIDPLGLAACDTHFPARKDALDAAHDRAGVPRGATPDARWEVGNDVTRRGTPGYRYSEDVGAHGNYSQFETEGGSRVIAEHTGTPQPHFHAGQPKGPDPGRTGVDFGWGGNKDFERYRPVGGKHHLYYPGG